MFSFLFPPGETFLSQFTDQKCAPELGNYSSVGTEHTTHTFLLLCCVVLCTSEERMTFGGDGKHNSPRPKQATNERC